MRLLLASILCAALLAVTSAAPVPKDASKPVLYFPTQVGAKWVYKEGDSEVVYRITSVAQRGEVARVTYGKEEGEKFVSEYVMVVSRNGLVMESDGLDGPLSVLKLPVTPSQTWTEECLSALLGKGKATFTAEAKDVVVPAGAYRTIRVRSVVSMERLEKEVIHEIWYAPEVGAVKEAYGHIVRELKSFTPAKP